MKAPLKPQLTQDVKIIEIAKIEVDKSLLIRRVNPFFIAMGTSGLMMDAIAVASNAYRYKQRAGAVHRMCVSLFEQTLMQSLSHKGFQANLSDKKYWDYFKPSQKHLRETVDGILRIRLKQMGFWSEAEGDGYFPSVLVRVELIDPLSRDVLYSDQFSMGIDLKSVEMMAAVYGQIHRLPLDDRFSGYKNFKTLLGSPKQSRDDLLKVMTLAVQRIIRGMQKPKSSTLFAFESKGTQDMPGVPFPIHVEDGIPQ